MTDTAAIMTDVQTLTDTAAIMTDVEITSNPDRYSSNNDRC